MPERSADCRLAIFEDAEVAHLNPLALTRAAFDLRPGIFSFMERIERAIDCAAVVLVCREQVSRIVAEAHPQCDVNPAETDPRTLYVNGRWIPEPGNLVDTLRAIARGATDDGPVAWVSGGVIVAAWASLRATNRRDAGEVTLVSRLHELVTDPGARIVDDVAFLDETFPNPAKWQGLAMVDEENVGIDESAELGAGVILNASSGPIIIEAEARVGDGAILRGPCHVAQKAHVNPGARITGSSIGYNCRAGGEISKSIMHAHANKAHDGYLGNSYVGEWCNLGADTNTSNLRNDYGPVSLYNEELGVFELTGEQFVGLIMGDHSACGINTMFNTGTVVGVGCNIFGAGYQPRHIKSFSWGSRERMVAHRPDKVLMAAEAMMKRRGREMTDAHRELLAHIAESD